MKPGYKQTEVGVIPEPGGFKAISRWLRSCATTPPDLRPANRTIPEGSQLASLRDAIPLIVRFRWYRCAQPPANSWHPSRMAVNRVEEHLTNMGAVWK